MYALSETEQRAILAQVCTPKEREAWESIEIRGRSLRHASLELGISLTSTKDRIASARVKVKNHLESAFPLRPDEPQQHEPEPPPDEQLAIALLIQRDGDHCYLCSKPTTPNRRHVEHIIPRHLGGTNDPTNLALACVTCNARKAGRIVSLLVSSGRPVYHATQANNE